MIKLRLKEVIFACCLVFMLAFIVVGFISYTVVKRFAFRRVHKLEWSARTSEFKELLCNTHGGKPVSFTSVGAITLSALLFVRPQAKRNLLLCHGYSRTKERLYELVKLFPDDTVLIFDYRAHGESQGDYTTIGFYEQDDVAAAYKFLTEHEQTKHLPIFGIGLSMGGVSLLGAASAGIPFKGIVVDSAFRNLYDQIAKIFSKKTGLPRMPFMSFCQTIFEYMCSCNMHDVNAIRWAERLVAPILIIHSNHDAMSDVAAAHELYAKVTGHKKLWIVDNAHHAAIFKNYPQDYLQQVTSFIDSIE